MSGTHIGLAPGGRRDRHARPAAAHNQFESTVPARPHPLGNVCQRKLPTWRCWARPAASALARWKLLPPRRTACAAVALSRACQPRCLGRAGPTRQAALDRGHRSGGRRGAGLVAIARQTSNCSPGPRAWRRLPLTPTFEIVVAAIVGSAGLRGTWAAVEAGKTVALANKETLVMAGPLVTELAAQQRGPHPAGRQRAQRRVSGACRPGGARKCERIILTASGGPFRNYTLEQLAEVTVDDALRPSRPGTWARRSRSTRPR